MLTKKILVEYLDQNPAKFAQKFGKLDLEKLDGEIHGYVVDKDGEYVLDGKKRKIPIYTQYSHAEVVKLAGVGVTARKPAPVVVEDEEEDDSSGGGDDLKDNG